MELPEELIKKIQEKILEIQDLVKDFKVDNFEYVFIGGQYKEAEEGSDFSSMDVIYSMKVNSEESLDEYLSFVSNAYSDEVRNEFPKGDTSDINFWLNLGDSDDSIN
jgi:hypothetical protein